METILTIEQQDFINDRIDYYYSNNGSTDVKTLTTFVLNTGEFKYSEFEEVINYIKLNY